MRTHLLALVLGAALPTAELSSQAPTPPPPISIPVTSFGTEDEFESIEQFVASAKTFAPDQSTSYMAWQFATTDLGQPGDPERGKAIRPSGIVKCDVVWNDDDSALVFVTARPPTQTAGSEVGLLFYLQRGDQDDKKWYIVDTKKFVARGKYASIDCKLTAYAGQSYTVTDNDAVVTITETQGGRGMAHDASASYRIFRGLVRAE